MTPVPADILTSYKEGRFLDEIAWLLFPREAKDKPTVMIVTGLDESFDSPNGKVFAVGAFLGRQDSWRKLEWQWDALLREYGLEYYHAVEAEHGRKQFDKPPFRTNDNLTREQFDLLRSVRSRFLALLTQGTLVGLVFGVNMDDFKTVASTQENLDKFGGTPYYFCYHMAMLHAVEAIRNELHSKELVAFIADRQEKHDAEMHRVYGKWQAISPSVNPYKSQIGSLTFNDKRNFVGLQAVDTLVYEVRKGLDAELRGGPLEDREAVKKLKDSHSIYKIVMCTKPCLEDVLKRADAANGPPFRNP